MTAPNPYAELMPLVRRVLYVPDSRPPAGWNERRDADIIRRLLRHRTAAQLAVAIEGLAILRDEPGKYGEEVDWLQPGTKVTLRALYNSRSGVGQMFELATSAYWRRERELAPPRASAALEYLMKGIGG